MKIKQLLMFLILSLVLLGVSIFVAAEEIKQPFPKDTSNIELGLSSLVIFFLFILILSIVFLFIFREKLMWILAIVGGLYALIIHLIFFDSGDAGVALGAIPLFWPVGLTGFFSGLMVAMFSPFINFTSKSFEVLAGMINILFWVIIGMLIGYVIKKKKGGKKNKSSENKIKKRNNKKLIIFFGGLVFFLISINVALALEWQYGSTHVHTGYSTKVGYDGNIFYDEDNCWQEGGIFGHGGPGYDVYELKEQALDMNIHWLAFSDHSYCLDSSEFNTVKSDCQAAQDSSFSCLWGEELSVNEDVSDTELMCILCYLKGW